MTRILTTTALAIALAAPAFATSTLRANVENMLETTAYDVQVGELSDEQVRGLYAALSGTDGSADMNQIVESIVNDDQFVMTGTTFDTETMGASNEIREAVQQMLIGESVDVDVSTLSNAQISALYLELTSGDDTDAGKIEAIVNG